MDFSRQDKRYAKICALALNGIFGYEPKFSHQIISTLGSAEAIFELSNKELQGLFGPYSQYPPLISNKSLKEAETQYDRLTNEGVEIISIFDDEYPKLLSECPDAPIALYVKGISPAAEIFKQRPSISVIGTRDISIYGRDWCKRIIEALSQAPSQPCIVSGMAIGVDICAHLSALEYGLPTIGVLPVGIDDIYPRRHRFIAERITQSPGCALLTDYPPGTSPVAFNFLRRNRIIAGISQACVLIESKIRGGGMMTTRLAASYGRDVVALPGRIDDICSQGCNLLIREKLAEPISSLNTLPEQLGLKSYRLSRKEDLVAALQLHFKDTLEAFELERIINLALAIKKHRGLCYDELCEQLDMDYSDVSRYCSLLESEGFLIIDLMQCCCINANYK